MEIGEVTYIGDGVYVRYDGWGYWLLANSHENPTDSVYLEESTLSSLMIVTGRYKETEDEQ